MHFGDFLALWDGYLFVLICFFGTLLLTLFGRFRTYLMQGDLKSFVNVIYWVLFATFYIFASLGLGALLLNGMFIPFLLSAAIIVLSVILFFKNENKESTTAVTYNEKRMKRNPVTQQIIDLIRAEKPERAMFYENGFVMSDFASLPAFDVVPMHPGAAYSIQVQKSIVPQKFINDGSSKVFLYKDHGYADMKDQNTIKTLASLIVKATRMYTMEEFELKHVRKTEMSDDYTCAYNITDTDGYAYLLTRNDLATPAVPKTSVPKTKLKSW